MLLTARDLIERLAHVEADTLIAVRHYQPGTKNEDLDFLNREEAVSDIALKDGNYVPVIILG